MKFEGTEDGNPTEWSLEMLIESSKDPAASRIVYAGQGTADLESMAGFEIVQIGDQQYMKFGEGEGSCMASSGGEGLEGFGELFKPEDLVGGLSDARRAGPDETVNGVRARHYTFDEKGLVGLTGLTRASGEAWVAVDGNYVVKYTLTAEGKDTLFGKANSEGKLTWTYEVTDVNRTVEIKPPAGCEGPAEDIPIMPDATDKSVFGTLISYKSPSAFREVLDFYQDEMPNNGWEASADEPLITDDFASLTYEKDGRKASITLTVDNDQVSVLISIEEP
jgi:hypothetical protein